MLDNLLPGPKVLNTFETSRIRAYRSQLPVLCWLAAPRVTKVSPVCKGCIGIADS